MGSLLGTVPPTAIKALYVSELRIIFLMSAICSSRRLLIKSGTPSSSQSCESWLLEALLDVGNARQASCHLALLAASKPQRLKKKKIWPDGRQTLIATRCYLRTESFEQIPAAVAAN